MNAKETNYSIIIRATSWCNYNCDMCIQKQSITHDRKVFEQDQQRLYIAMSLLSNMIAKSNINKFSIDLIGGEVTWFDLIHALSYLSKNESKQKINRIYITTNFSNTIDSYNKLVEFIDSNGWQSNICCSYHPDMADFNVFIQKFINLKAKTKTIEFVQTKDNRDYLTSLINECEKLNLAYIVDIDNRPEKEYRIDKKDFIFSYKKCRNYYSDKTKSVQEHMIYGTSSKDKWCVSRSMQIVLNKSNKKLSSFVMTPCMNLRQTSIVTNLDDVPTIMKCPFDICTCCGRFKLFDTYDEALEYKNELIRINT